MGKTGINPTVAAEAERLEALLLAAGLAAEQIDQVWDRYVLNRRNDHETSQTTRTDCTLDRPA